jgi:hypothetical protein
MNNLKTKSVLNKKFKFFLILLISLIFVFIIIYRLASYTPVFLDYGKRNFIEKTIDFLSFGWHFTKASIYKQYLKNRDKAEKELGKAGWYRKKVLVKYFRVNGKDLNSVLTLYNRLKIDSISEKIDVFLKRKQKN